MVQHPAFLDRRALRVKALAAAVLAVLLPMPAFAQANPDLYARIDQRLAAAPEMVAKIGKPAAEMAQLDWVIGEWDVVTTVDGRDAAERGSSVVTRLFGGTWLEVRDTYPQGVQDISYIGYSAANARWTTLSIDSLGNANSASSAGWQGDHMVFEGDFLILGENAHLRQTVTRVRADEYRVDNEELLGGTWKHLDTYRYTRKPKP
jgi:hypothetical protein